jgi:hypothetical protein
LESLHRGLILKVLINLDSFGKTYSVDEIFYVEREKMSERLSDIFNCYNLFSFVKPKNYLE